MHIETVGEFCEAHGKAGAPVQLGDGRWLFPDCWACFGDLRNPSPWTVPVHQSLPPPAEEGTRLRIKRAYHNARAETFARDFAGLKNSLQGRSAAGFSWDESRHGPDPDDPVRALERVRDLVHAERAAVAELDKRIAALPEEQERRRQRDERQRWESEQQARQAHIAHAIDAIQL